MSIIECALVRSQDRDGRAPHDRSHGVSKGVERGEFLYRRPYRRSAQDCCHVFAGTNDACRHAPESHFVGCLEIATIASANALAPVWVRKRAAVGTGIRFAPASAPLASPRSCGEFAAARDPNRFAIERLVLHAIRDHEFLLRVVTGFDHLAALFDRVRHRLFAQHVCLRAGSAAMGDAIDLRLFRARDRH
jgi:hypothetical protein